MADETDFTGVGESERPDNEPWPYSAGHKGINRVRVYDRDDSNCIQIEWWDDRGRIQRSLRTVVGEPVTDRDLARDIADRVAEAQKRKRNAAARRAVFGREGISLGTLLDKLHEARGPDWSESYTRDQDRFKKFWLEKLGEDTNIYTIGRNPVRIETIARDEAAERDWSPRTHQSYLRYIVDAFYFAQNKLKALEERYNLSAVDIPSPQSQGKAYSPDETAKLLPALMETDVRAGIVGEAYYQAGRRLNATRLLKAEDVRFATFQTEHGPVDAAILSYGGDTDKAGKTSEAVLVGDVVERVRALLDTEAVRSSGRLLPHGALDEPSEDPITKEELNDLLHEAEEAAGIEHVPYRAYHGLKRRFSGASKDHRAVAALQSGTSEEMLRDTYDPDDDLQAKAALAAELDRRRRVGA